MLGELGIVDPDRINPLMEHYFDGHNQHGMQSWLILSTEVWLRARAGGQPTH
jgi:hypothetical protein